MSLRALFLLLLFANLAYLAWADLIDVPPEPPAALSISQLPQLKLLSEVRGKTAAPAQPAQGSGPSSSTDGASSGSAASSPDVPPGAGASSGSSGSSSPAAPANSPGASSPATHPPAASPPAASPPAAVLQGAVPSGREAPGVAHGSAAALRVSDGPPHDPALAGAARRCIAIGPFAAAETVQEATDLLRQRGFSPRQRTQAGAPRGYWVFIGGLKSPTDEARVVQRLERNGISDAKAMPASAGTLRVSVGLFNAREGAERRARAVGRLGLDAEIQPRPSAVEHWVDVDLDSSTQTLPAEGLLSLQESGSRLEIKECPSPKSDAGSTHSQGTAGSKMPGTQRAPATVPDFKPQIPKPLTNAGRPRPG